MTPREIMRDLPTLGAMLTFAVHALSVDTVPSNDDAARLLRISPLFCFYELIQDVVNIATLVPHSEPTSDHGSGLGSWLSTRARWSRNGRRILTSLSAIFGVMILFGPKRPWTKCFTTIYMLHWLVKELRSRQVIELETNNSHTLMQKSDRSKLTRGLFVGITQLYITALFDCGIAQMFGDFCYACIMASIDLDPPPVDRWVSSYLVGFCAYGISVLILATQEVAKSKDAEMTPELGYAIAMTCAMMSASVVLCQEFRPRPTQEAAMVFFAGGLALYSLAYAPGLLMSIIVRR